MVKKEVALPEFYAIEDIEQCKIEVDPKQPIDELEHKAEKRQDGTVNYLKVKFWITGSKKLVEISLISNSAQPSGSSIKIAGARYINACFLFALPLATRICILSSVHALPAFLQRVKKRSTA